MLTINPQWVSVSDSLPSYAWSAMVDKMIHTVKQSKKIVDMVNEAMDVAESKLGFKILANVRQDILRYCDKAAERRLSVRAYPGPKGKDFVIMPPIAAPAVASELVKLAKDVLSEG